MPALNEYAPPPWPRRESYAARIDGSSLVVKKGCRRTITDYEGNILDDSLIPYAILRLEAGLSLMILSLHGEEIGIYSVTKDGSVRLQHGDAVSGNCVVWRRG